MLSSRMSCKVLDGTDHLLLDRADGDAELRRYVLVFVAFEPVKNEDRSGPFR
jgi:hypothetical protein